MKIIKFIFRIYNILINKSYSTLSGAIAFFLVVNGGSLLYLFLVISNFLHISITPNFLIDATIIEEVSKKQTGSFIYSLIFIITSIYGSSSLFFHILKAGELIYQRPHQRISLFRRVTSLVFMLAFMGIIETFLIVVFLGDSLFHNPLWRYFRYFLFMIIPFLLSLCLHFFAIPEEVKFIDLRKGAILTTLLWYLTSLAFILFLNIFTNYKAFYGSLSFFVIFMIWLYLLAQGFIVGIIYNYYYHEKKINLLSISQTIDGTPKEDI